jgi:hypothetical protein
MLRDESRHCDQGGEDDRQHGSPDAAAPSRKVGWMIGFRHLPGVTGSLGAGSRQACARRNDELRQIGSCRSTPPDRRLEFC